MTKTWLVTGAIAGTLAISVYCRVGHYAEERPIVQEQRQAIPSAARELALHEKSEGASAPRIAQPAKTDLGFKLTPSGDLEIDDVTRDVVEELSAVADLSELHEIKDHLRRTLPSPAGETAADLVERYHRYRIALDERLRTDEMTESPQDPTIGLEALKALRTDFFGAELAGSWFGREESVSSAMIVRDERSR